MIEWESEIWGNRVHLASSGSWVTDRHGEHGTGQDQ
jgi:hypothetical protein